MGTFSKERYYIMTTYRSSLAFTRLSDSPLNSFAENTVVKLTGNAGLPTPTAPLTAVTGAQQAFNLAITTAKNGGKQATAAKNARREELIALLRQNAAYVQSIAGEDLELLLTSGYEASSNSRNRIMLPPPVVELVDNPQSTKLGLRLSAVPTARAYEVRIKQGATEWQQVGIYTYSRPIIIENLTPGTIYTMQARAVGGTTGYSDWSDPVSHMAM